MSSKDEKDSSKIFHRIFHISHTIVLLQLSSLLLLHVTRIFRPVFQVQLLSTANYPTTFPVLSSNRFSAVPFLHVCWTFNSFWIGIRLWLDHTSLIFLGCIYLFLIMKLRMELLASFIRPSMMGGVVEVCVIDSEVIPPADSRNIPFLPSIFSALMIQQVWSSRIISLSVIVTFNRFCGFWYNFFLECCWYIHCVLTGQHLLEINCIYLLPYTGKRVWLTLHLHYFFPLGTNKIIIFSSNPYTVHDQFQYYSLLKAWFICDTFISILS